MDFWQIPHKRKVHNSRIRDDINMKLGSVTKFDKKNKTKSKKKKKKKMKNKNIVTLMSFFQFMVNLEQCRSRITGVWSVKFMFSLIVTFYFTKPENRTKKPLPQKSLNLYRFK